MSFLPGTYGTALMRSHALAGAYRKMAEIGFPDTVIEGIRDSIDCNIYFFGHKAEQWAMYAVLVGATVLLTALYVLLYRLSRTDERG